MGLKHEPNFYQTRDHEFLLDNLLQHFYFRDMPLAVFRNEDIDLEYGYSPDLSKMIGRLPKHTEVYLIDMFSLIDPQSYYHETPKHQTFIRVLITSEHAIKQLGEHYVTLQIPFAHHAITTLSYAKENSFDLQKKEGKQGIKKKATHY